MRRRIVPAVAAATLVIAGLTACSTPGVSADACVNPLQPGPLTESVKLGENGAISVPGPRDILNAERVVHASTAAADSNGKPAVAGGIVTADLAIYDAATGGALHQAENTPFLVPDEANLTEVRTALNSESSNSVPVNFLLSTALLCSVPGDSIVVASTAAQSAASQIGTAPTIAVLHVRSTAPASSHGSVNGLPSGFPAVTTDHTGRPGIVLPPQKAPSKITVAERITGSGDEVSADDSVIGQVLSVSWPTAGESKGKVEANTWETGITGFGSESTPNPDFTFRASLNGHKVGSQLVIIDPNDGKPVVHVVDIVSAS